MPVAFLETSTVGLWAEDENAISHLFGQTSICVAMDFPGWFEAAGVCFFIAGLFHAFALYQIYRYCKGLWGGTLGKLGSPWFLRT